MNDTPPVIKLTQVQQWRFDNPEKAKEASRRKCEKLKALTKQRRELAYANGKELPYGKRIAYCAYCGESFYPDQSGRKFCRPACYQADLKSKKASELNSNPKIPCSLCHAKIGFGVTISSRLLKVTECYLATRWKALGVKQQKPDGKNSWREATAGLRLLKKTYTKQFIEALYMSEYKVRFPDWHSLANSYMAAKRAIIKYRNMNLEQKKLFLQNQFAGKKRRGYKKNLAYMKDWRKRNKEKSNQYARKATKKRKAIDPGFRVQCNLRRRFKDIMKSAKKGGWNSYSNLIGCTSQELAAHIEKQFKKGMTWDNYGIDGWHVDHIMPCSKFDHTNELHVRQCWHFTNLRPLWAKDNMVKSDAITHPQLQLAL